MCPQAVPVWVLPLGVIAGLLLMLGVVGMWGLKGGVVLITLMGIGAVWAVSEIISVHRMGC